MENEVNQVTEHVTNIVNSDAFLGNSYGVWMRAAIIFSIIFFSISAIKFIGKKIYRKHQKENVDEITFKNFFFSNVAMFNVFIAIFIAQYPTIISLAMPAKIDKISKYLFIVAIFGQLLIWANNTLNLYGKQYVQKHPNAVTSLGVFSLMWKVAAFTLIIVIMLDQLGFNITALLAGLGVGGIAIAFALQNVLSDVFGSLAIIFDKPFQIGDTIQIGTFTGRVEKVGLKTTRVRSAIGEQLVFSNNELLKSTIQNFGDLQERRVSIMVGVTYETPYEKLKKVPDIIREAIFSQNGTSVNHVTLKQLADSSLNFEVWYYIQVQEQGKWLDTEHCVNLEIVRLFEKEGISFAYPTRTVYTKSL